MDPEGARGVHVGPAEPPLLGHLGVLGESRRRLELTWQGQQAKGLNCGFVMGALLVRGDSGREKAWQIAAGG